MTPFHPAAGLHVPATETPSFLLIAHIRFILEECCEKLKEEKHRNGNISSLVFNKNVFLTKCGQEGLEASH